MKLPNRNNEEISAPATTEEPRPVEPSPRQRDTIRQRKSTGRGKRKSGSGKWKQGKIKFILSLLTKGGMTKAEIAMEAKEKFSIKKQTAVNTTNWCASMCKKLTGKNSKHKQ